MSGKRARLRTAHQVGIVLLRASGCPDQGVVRLCFSEWMDAKDGNKTHVCLAG